MTNSSTLTIGLISISLVLFSLGIPKSLEKKIRKEVVRTFEVEEFNLESVAISDNIKDELPANLSAENFFKLTSGEDFMGYVFFDKAPSKTAEFDYLVLFDTNLRIVRSRVLIYREEYGGEIGSNRWLRQFVGKSGNDRVNYETNIDGISGATISVRSMTIAIDNLLQTIGILQEHNIL